MTIQQLNTRFVLVAVLGIAGVTSGIAATTTETSATVAFMTAAEKFGIFAAMSLTMTALAVFGLWKLGTYVIYRLEAVVDDNTLSFNRFATQMRKRPCQHDSDIDKIVEKDDKEDSGDDMIVKRVQDRQKSRQDRMKTKETT